MSYDLFIIMLCIIYYLLYYQYLFLFCFQFLILPVYSKERQPIMVKMPKVKWY